jgi:hypothetical protein
MLDDMVETQLMVSYNSRPPLSALTREAEKRADVKWDHDCFTRFRRV